MVNHNLARIVIVGRDEIKLRRIQISIIAILSQMQKSNRHVYYKRLKKSMNKKGFLKTGTMHKRFDAITRSYCTRNTH